MNSSLNKFTIAEYVRFRVMSRLTPWGSTVVNNTFARVREDSESIFYKVIKGVKLTIEYRTHSIHMLIHRGAEAV